MKNLLLWWRPTDVACNRAAKKRGKPISRPARLRRSFVPCVDVLEDRTLPSTLTVMNLNDSGSGSLRAAIIAANAHSGDTIQFANGLHGTLTLTSGELPIIANVTINGPGANKLSISGNHASRIFEIAAGLTVSVNNLTITHGYALEEGGGVLNDGSNLTLAADVLLQNVAIGSATNDFNGGAYGGALFSEGGTLEITGCQICNNQALGGASAVGLAIGGGLNIAAGNATVSDSTISGNLARGADNSSDGIGEGGGIDLSAGTLAVNHTTIASNLAVGGANSAFASGEGGGLANAGSLTLTASILNGNESVGGDGGIGSYVGEAEGGAIANYGPNGGGKPGTLTISGSTFVNNQALAGNDGNSGPGAVVPGVDESYGAGIFNFGGSMNVYGTSFSHNDSIGGNHATATGSDIVEVGVAEGGAICNEIGSIANFSNCSFLSNQAIGGNGNSSSGPVVHVGAGFGAGIFSGFGGNDVGANPLTLTNCTLTANTSQGGNGNTGTATVEGFIGAGVGGGVMNYLGGSASVYRSTVQQNLACGGQDNSGTGTGAVFSSVGAGGGILNGLGNYNSSGYGPFNASVASISGCIITQNQAKGGAGGDALGGGLANVLSATATLTGSFLIQNQANGNGGAGLGGGAYNAASSSLALSYCVVTQNRADGSPGIGGGVYTLGTFSDAFTIIGGNHASTSGDNIGP
jgi:hypothetical protein